MKQSVATAKRLVIKIGSSLLVDNKTGALHCEWLSSLVQDVVEYFQQGKDIIIVSSGAVALGRRHLQLKNSALLKEKQAAAAVGQIKLSHAYQEALGARGITAAQVLLTLDDSESRGRYLNAKNTLETLLNLHAIPVINENDTVATAEIRYGDNDRLAARVAQMVSADTLVLLSDIEGLYTANPHTNEGATLIPEVKNLTPEILAMAGDSSTEYGSGGMITKLAAAKIAMASGCRMVIAAGKHFNPLTRIDRINECTWFTPDTTPMKARKSWIAQHLKPMGFITADAGAISALFRGKSLLSAGVVGVEGNFRKGDAVSIVGMDKREIAKGLMNYAAHEALKIMGRKSADYEVILGYCGYDEMIHRDNLVLTVVDV